MKSPSTRDKRKATRREQLPTKGKKCFTSVFVSGIRKARAKKAAKVTRSAPLQEGTVQEKHGTKHERESTGSDVVYEANSYLSHKRNRVQTPIVETVMESDCLEEGVVEEDHGTKDVREANSYLSDKRNRLETPIVETVLESDCLEEGIVEEDHGVDEAISPEHNGSRKENGKGSKKRRRQDSESPHESENSPASKRRKEDGSDGKKMSKKAARAKKKRTECKAKRKVQEKEKSSSI